MILIQYINWIQIIRYGVFIWESLIISITLISNPLTNSTSTSRWTIKIEYWNDEAIIVEKKLTEIALQQ